MTINVNGHAYLATQAVKVSGTPVGAKPVSEAFDFATQAITTVPNGYIFTAFAMGNTSTASLTYNWNFGDGHTDTSTIPVTTHVYADSNNYTVTLSINGYGGTVQHPVVPRRRTSHH